MKNLTQAARAAKLIKYELSKLYPFIKFSVKSDSYSMGDSVSINYTDGVPLKEIELIVKKYQYGKFDSMQDMYEITNDRKDLPQTKYVLIQREMSDTVKDELLLFIQNQYYGAAGLSYNDFCSEHGEYMCTLIRRLFYDKYYVPDALDTNIDGIVKNK